MAVVRRLRELLDQQPVVLLDYETNEDVADVTRPLSHAGLVKGWCSSHEFSDFG